MAKAKANGIEIEYDTFGDRSSPPLLLIMGLGSHMIYWDEGLCENLAKVGLFVIRFDNRDIGLSSKIDEAGDPDLMQAFQAKMSGHEIKAFYTFDEMTDDAVGLLDYLGVEKAHICGISMGSAITQTIGIRHPSRVLSLIPIMGATGNPENPPINPEMFAPLLTPFPEDLKLDFWIDSFLKINRMWTGKGYPFNEEWFTKKAIEAYNRSTYSKGLARQILAGMAHGDRRPGLALVKATTLVIHGADDPLIHPDCGIDTAKSIPGAKLLIIEGMGHELPHGTGPWLKVFDAIVDHTKNVAG